MISSNSYRQKESTKRKPAKKQLELPEALRRALKPPERLTVSQWADKNRILDLRTSSMPGPWKTSFIPYAKEPMDSFSNPEIEHIILCFGSQGSKTEILINMIGYATDQDPGPMLVVYPEDDTAKFAGENRIEPMVLSVPALKNKFDQRNSEKLELKFDDVFIALNGANSPSKLASKPIRYLIRDEINKFKQWTGKEANPLDLSEERTKTFPHNKKIVDASTPTLKSGNITVMTESADSQREYFVPCPHCGHKQIFEFKQIKWPKEINNDPKLVRDLAWYECINCHEVIEDCHKPQMLALGKWKQINEHSGRIRSVAYHINSIASPFVTFGEMANKFLLAKDYPEKLMNFINSWLAEPWEEKATRMKSDVIMEMQTEHERGVVPNESIILTAGIDVQLDHFYYVVRAWGEKLTSWLVDRGRVEMDILEPFAEIESRIIEKPYPNEWGEALYINLAGMDSGYRTEDVYNFCAWNQQVMIPTKGSSHALRSRYQVSKIEKDSAADGLLLYIFDPVQMKNFIAGRLSKEAGTPGSWNVFKNIDREYADQICSEQRREIPNKQTGQITVEWQKISSHAQNHYLDAEVNALLAAEVLGVYGLMKQQAAPEVAEPESDPEPVRRKPKGSSFIGGYRR